MSPGIPPGCRPKKFKLFGSGSKKFKIVGNSFLSSELSYDSSNLFSNNVFNFLSYIIKDDKIIEEDDEIVNNCKI